MLTVTETRLQANRGLHVALVVLYWVVLLGLIGEESVPKDRNFTLAPLTLLVIAFGIWRVIRKQHRKRLARRVDRPQGQ